MKRFVWNVFAILLFGCAMVPASLAQTFHVVSSFYGANGGNPYGSLLQANDGNLYGTAYSNGANAGGTVFKINSAGQFSTVYDFCGKNNCTDGYFPLTGLVQAMDGFFYGTTSLGGSTAGCNPPYGCGSLFRITAAGNLTNIYDFGSMGLFSNEPSVALVQSPDLNFYGLTTFGQNGATAFEITPAGTLTTLYTFDGSAAGLMQSPDGNFYVTTYYGGAHGFGAIYRMSPEGAVSTLYDFCSQKNCTDGEYPGASLVWGDDGNLYGTTSEDGGVNASGTVFKISPSGQLTTLYTFCSQPSCGDGGYPLGMVQGSDGNFYGVTYYGGINGGFARGAGTLFKITPAGKLTTLHSFCSQTNCPDGSNPYAALTQDTDGNFYGTTVYGGSNGFACAQGVVCGPCGTVFRLSVGLGPFASLVHATAQVGKTIAILGQGLTGTTSVSFNGTPAGFAVKTDTYMAATEPAGATSGRVTVTTPSGILTSNTPFIVRP
jgi:uncharacterized repeat protein (TIGR03803 family)